MLAHLTYITFLENGHIFLHFTVECNELHMGVIICSESQRYWQTCTLNSENLLLKSALFWFVCLFGVLFVYLFLFGLVFWVLGIELRDLHLLRTHSTLSCALDPEIYALNLYFLPAYQPVKDGNRSKVTHIFTSLFSVM